MYCRLHISFDDLPIKHTYIYIYIKLVILVIFHSYVAQPEDMHLLPQQVDSFRPWRISPSGFQDEQSQMLHVWKTCQHLPQQMAKTQGHIPSGKLT